MTLRVLAVIDDDTVKRTVQHVVVDEGNPISFVRTVDEAVAIAHEFDVAFVELKADGGAALALCHHLPSVNAAMPVHAIVHPEELARGEEALSLGAAGVIVAPPTGEAIGRVLNELEKARVRASEVNRLEAMLARERKRLETYDRLVRFARNAAPSDAVRAIVDGVSTISAALGVALYATFGGDETELVLLASVGTALDLPPRAAPAELGRVMQSRQARVVPLVASSGEIGLLILDQPPLTAEPEVAQLADLAAAMLALVDRKDHLDDAVRVFSHRQFSTVADRMLTLAGRHDRRAAVLAVAMPDKSQRREELTLEIADIIRNTDAMCGTADDDLLLFLPETTGLGAHQCRRRILARLTGDRRSRPRSSGSRTTLEPRSKGPPIAIGVAVFPHDGLNLKRLVKSARARAMDDRRSPVHALALEGLSLPDVVDALIARPIFDAGPRSPYPLDIACAALFSLVARACRDGLRGGDTSVITTLQPGLGVAAAARQVTTPKVLDIRPEPGCENLEAVVVEGEHGAWVCCGRVVGERFRGVHAADPLLADVVSRRLSSAGAMHG